MVAARVRRDLGFFILSSELWTPSDRLTRLTNYRAAMRTVNIYEAAERRPADPSRNAVSASSPVAGRARTRSWSGRSAFRCPMSVDLTNQV